MPRTQRAPFDPAAWAEARRLKIAKAEKLRKQHKMRMEAVANGDTVPATIDEFDDGPLKNGVMPEWENPFRDNQPIHTTNQSPSIREYFDLRDDDEDSPNTLTAVFDRAYMNKEGNYRYDEHRNYLTPSRGRGERYSSPPDAERLVEENAPVAGELWRGMLRDHDTDFMSEDPLVFGKPKKKAAPAVSKVRKPVAQTHNGKCKNTPVRRIEAGTIQPRQEQSNSRLLKPVNPNVTVIERQKVINDKVNSARKSGARTPSGALLDRPYSASSQQEGAMDISRPSTTGSSSRARMTPKTSITRSDATPQECRENIADETLQDAGSAKGFLPGRLQKQLDRRHEEREKNNVRLPRLTASASDGEQEHLARHSALADGGAKKRARSVTKKKDDDEKCYRQMFDKNTLRLMHRQLFMDAVTHRPAIANIPHERGDADVKVLVRKRPIFSKEREKDFDIVSTSSTSCMISNCLFQADLKVPFFVHSTFHFDNAFGENHTNLDVYHETREVVDFAATGGLGTMFMLGQTGSGKTHTMTAIEEYAAKDLFSIRDLIGVRVSFLEVRANKVYDLLDSVDNREVKLLNMSGKYVTEDAISFMCQSADELITCVRTGHDRRATQCTEANDTSSRSHALCVLTIETGNGTGGKLVLVDCAGTERRKDSMHHSKERQAEGAHINASLHALKECIRLRAENAHVPSHAYRASSLTKLLAEAFSVRNGKLLVICTVSPCATDTEHSLTTLRTGFCLSGRPKTCMVEEKQSDLKELVFGKPKRLHPMNRWTWEEVSAWLRKLGQGELAAVAPGTTGHMLVRMAESRFVQVLGERRGRKLFDLVRAEIERSAGRK
eukprot:GEMP01004122.1.p1 GENE.GEMP01004122.1~~GEMP01004122.1.p1  ORF type:complete len:838 (+),score=162.95 GEMP01004122.1:25-2538(+)